MTPDQAVRILRAKAAELERNVPAWIDSIPDAEYGDLCRHMSYISADIALVASILADFMETMEGRLNAILEIMGKQITVLETQERLRKIDSGTAQEDVE